MHYRKSQDVPLINRSVGVNQALKYSPRLECGCIDDLSNFAVNGA
jgi:hypothetical protein